MHEETPIEIELPEPDERIVQAKRLNDAAMAVVEKSEYTWPTSLSMLRRSINLYPEHAETWSNLGLVLWRLGQIEEAGDALHRALALNPDKMGVHANLGVFLGAVGRADEATHHFAEAIRLEPDNLASRWDLALLQLRNGDWKTGLRGYDIRREHRGPKLYPTLPAPLWQGENLAGKHLYIQGEQGIGDRLLFSRYLSWIKQTWPSSHITVCLFDQMTNLFWEHRHLVDFLPTGAPIPENIDYAVWLCSLPEIHGTTIDAVPPDPGLLRKRILRAREGAKLNVPQPKIPALKIGLCWTGNPEQARNPDRSIPLDMLLPLTEHPNLVFYSFQCSPGNADFKTLCCGDLLYDFSGDIEREGWVGTGMALMEMDLVLSVCTSVVHLAGAIGVPAWVMLCADPYWIWGRSGTTTPWYPGMKLFRQKRLGDWTTVIAEVKAELNKLVAATINHEPE